MSGQTFKVCIPSVWNGQIGNCKMCYFSSRSSGQCPAVPPQDEGELLGFGRKTRCFISLPRSLSFIVVRNWRARNAVFTGLQPILECCLQRAHELMAAAAMEVLLQERPKGIVSHTIVCPETHARSRTFRCSESLFILPTCKRIVPSTDWFGKHVFFWPILIACIPFHNVSFQM